MEFLTNYGMFLAKTATTVIAILIILAFVIAMATRSKAKTTGKLRIKKINEKFEEMADIINEAIQSKSEAKQKKKTDKKAKKHEKEKQKANKPTRRIFIVNFNGDIKASAVAALREEITGILLTAQSNDRVLCRLESPGGMVNAYGLAASQLGRLKEAGIRLIVAVDKVAASGGYMMACVANEIIAAPFSVIGSIGVIAQLPNFHRFLEKKNIDFEQLTAGDFKRTLTMFGKNTNKAREKMQSDIEEIHTHFKDFIHQNRSSVDIDEVATGEHWLATRALELNLVDRLQTSDDYILDAKDEFDIYEVHYHIKKSLGKRLSEGANLLMSKFMHAETL